MMEILSLFYRTREARTKLEQHRARLYRVAYSWSHNPALSDDLVQETLTKAMQKSSQLRDPNAGEAWLFSIMANCYRDHFRRNRETEDVDNITLVHDTTPESENARLETVEKVRSAVARLPEGHRQVVTLVDLEGFSYVEAADILGIPIGTVMSRLCRARNTLRTQLLDEFKEQQSVQDAHIRRIK